VVSRNPASSHPGTSASTIAYNQKNVVVATLKRYLAAFGAASLLDIGAGDPTTALAIVPALIAIFGWRRRR
jgi:hypothetical protein